MAEKLGNWSNQLLIQMENNSIIYREKWGNLNWKEIFLVKTIMKIIGEELLSLQGVSTIFFYIFLFLAKFNGLLIKFEEIEFVLSFWKIYLKKM
jgi:hypothetical protein